MNHSNLQKVAESVFFRPKTETVCYVLRAKKMYKHPERLFDADCKLLAVMLIALPLLNQINKKTKITQLSY